MMRLGPDVLAMLPDSISVPGYDRQSTGCAVVHLGVGNFHRAHQAAYFDALLNQGYSEWGIVGVSLHSPATRDALQPQDGLYTLVERGANDDFRVIGALRELLVAPDNPAAVIERLASPETELITVTITEKGYLLGDDGVDCNHSLIVADATGAQDPVTVFGYLAAGLARRAQEEVEPVTVLCCDNVKDGGAILRDGTCHVIAESAPECIKWVERHVSFISSVVDRVTPATTDALIAEVADVLGVQDAWPVATEPFHSWVIEDDFAGKCPPLDRVGALIVPSLKPYERMKLTCLNAAHSIVAALGFLVGEESVHEAIAIPEIRRFVRDTIQYEVLPNTKAPEGVNASRYLDDVIARFDNAALPYRNAQVLSDSSQKVQQRWFPSINAALQSGTAWSRLAFVVAAWVAAVRKMVSSDQLSDPCQHELVAASEQNLSDERVTHTLLVANADRCNFFSHSAFMEQVGEWYELIRDSGIVAALEIAVSTHRFEKEHNA